MHWLGWRVRWSMRSRTERRPPRSGRLAALLLLCLGCNGCTALYFSVANLPARLAPVQRVSAVAYGNLARQRLDVYVPQAAQPGRPLLVFFYGGAWDSGSRSAYRFVGTALAELGYVTVVPDYRLYPAVKFPAFIDDGAQAVAWAQRHAADYGADPRRVVLLGHSAGAHLAAMLAIDAQYLQRAGVDPASVAGFVALSGPHDLRPDTAVLNSIFAAPYSPQDWQVIPRVRGPAPPALLLHGATDRRVWPRASELLAQALRAAGSDVTLKVYPHCNHVCTVAALSVPARHQAPVLADIQDFLQGLPATLPAAGTHSTARRR